MPTRILLIALAALLATSCSGRDKHLPSSNPPEYDPNTVETFRPAAPSPRPTKPAKPPVSGEPAIALPSLEPGPGEKGEWRKVPMKLESLQQLKGAKTLCDALSQLVHGLGSAQLFAGVEGAALKKSLGSHAEATAQMLDEQLAESMKQAFGPAAENCPTPSTKSGQMGSFKDLSQPALIVLTKSSSSHPLLLAQGAASQASGDGYTVTITKQKQDAPPGWIGWKSTDRTTRVGNRRETTGNSSTTVLVLGGKALKCPTPDGVVHGDYEYAMMFDQTIMETGATRSVHVGQRAVATLKGLVGDDAKLQYIEVDVSLVIERGGTDLSAVARRERHQFRFTQDRGFPMLPTQFSESSGVGWGSEASAADIDTLNSLLAGIMGFSGVLYMQAEQEWWKPNTCVEITFKPATKTYKLGPNESVPVKTELRTKKEQTVVPAKFKEARERPRERNGTVSPREDQSQPDTPATFTYQAPPTRVRHSGFRVSAVSRAGVAEAKDGEWELAPSSYVLEFKSHIVQSPLNFLNPQFGMGLSSNGFDAHVQATVPLQHRDDRGWVGEGVMQYETRTTTQPAQCEIRIQGTGTTTFHVNGGSISSDPEPFAVNLIILPGRSGEVAETHCSSANTPEKLKELFASQGVQGGEAHSVTKGGGWSAAFNLTRFRTFIGTPGRQGYEIGGWTSVRDSDVIANKTITVNCSMGMSACREETTLTLKLADEPGAAASPP